MSQFEVCQLRAKFITLIVPCSRYTRDQKFQLLWKGLDCESFACTSNHLNHWVIILHGSMGDRTAIACKGILVQILLSPLDFAVQSISWEKHYQYFELTFIIFDVLDDYAQLYPMVNVLCVVGTMRGWLRDVDQFISKFLIFFMHIHLFFNHVLYLYPFQISKLIMKCWNN